MSPIVIILLVLIAALAAWLMWQVRNSAAGADRTANPAQTKPRKTPSAPASAARAAAYSTEPIDAAVANGYRLAFGVAQLEEAIADDHAEVLARIETSIDTAIHQPEYFPRRPMLLPKLLRALNDTDSTRQELVSLILEDPALAGNVLRRANSALYRITPAPVDSLDRAIVNLGMEGLRSLMGTAILQPVFRMRTGLFDRFATLTWEQAQRASVAAETYAKKTRSCDPFVAQLLGVLRPLAHIVLFKLALERYRDQPGLQPRAEVFVRVMRKHSRRVAHLVATTWELPDPSLKALDEQQRQISPGAMSPLGRAVYFGDLCGTFAILAVHGDQPQESALTLLIEQGLDRETALVMWHVATTAETDL
jgi:HD-like signal output (HDOD) protein